MRICDNFFAFKLAVSSGYYMLIFQPNYLPHIITNIRQPLHDLRHSMIFSLTIINIVEFSLLAIILMINNHSIS